MFVAYIIITYIPPTLIISTALSPFILFPQSPHTSSTRSFLPTAVLYSKYRLSTFITLAPVNESFFAVVNVAMQL